MKLYDLSGEWQFAYSRPDVAALDAEVSREREAGWKFSSEKPSLDDAPADFSRTITVPGYWDDQKESFAGLDLATNPDYAPIPYPMDDNLDASLPYIIGTVWYKRTFTLEDDTPYAELTLAGVSTEARVWVNGYYVGQAFGYSTPHAFSLDGYLNEGENTLLIAVDNDPHEHLGCITRGWKGFTGGLCRGVTLRATGRCRIKDAAAYARDMKFFTLDMLFDGDTEGAEVRYKVCEGVEIVKDGSFPLDGAVLKRDIPAFGLEHWSDVHPHVYELKLTVYNRDGVADKLTIPFGFRVFRRDGIHLKLNDRPVFLRGATEHAYYPETCTAPAALDTYLRNLTILKEFGFNFLRFHTSVPNEEYMTAADRLGFLIQLEGPVKFTLDEWEDILRTCRRHPSVAITCGGNEELLDEDKIAYLSRAAQLSHTIAPATLFNPQEALRGIEYGWKDSDMGDCVEEPSRHNPRRLAMLKRFSDLFGQYSWGFLSYDSSTGENHELDRRYKVYERPLLSHELGIYGSYVDLSLEKRYEGTRIGTEMYAKAREYLTREGLIDNWKTYWYNSCLYQSSIRKGNIETARKCRRLSGFDYLGAIDHHWHHTGYQCGVMNEFYEEKPGSSRAEVLLWNAPVVLLWDNRTRYTFACGEEFVCPFMISQYGTEDWAKSKLTWMLTDENGHPVNKGEWEIPGIPCGRIQEIGDWKVKMPAKTGKYTLTAGLSDGAHTVTNHWNLWCFDTAAESAENVKVVDTLTAEDIASLENGAKILLTDTAPFPAVALDFQPMPSGRPLGMVATVIKEHPAFGDFPHDNWCDWQFANLLRGATAVRWGTINKPENPAEYRPILDVCMGYKRAGRFAAVCEFKVGSGRLLVCGLNLKGENPEQTAMKNNLVRYLSAAPADAPELSADALRKFMQSERDVTEAEVDKGFDKAGQKAL